MHYIVLSALTNRYIHYIMYTYDIAKWVLCLFELYCVCILIKYIDSTKKIFYNKIRIKLKTMLVRYSLNHCLKYMTKAYEHYRLRMLF